MWMWENRKFRKCAKILGVTAAVYGVFRFLLPLVAPFVFAWLTALALKPLACRISGILRVRWRGRSVGISVGAAGLLELAVILGIGGTLLYAGDESFMGRRLCWRSVFPGGWSAWTGI